MDKIIFKPLALGDAKLIFDNREFIVSHFNGGITKKEYNSWTLKDEIESVKKDVAGMRADKYKYAVFIILDKKEYVGKCILNRINIDNKSASVSVSIKEKFWGKGYGTLAVQFLEKLAFSKMKLNRLGYDCYSNNLRSQRLAKKLGFKYEGKLREAKKIGNKYYDRLIHSKLKSEYKKP